MKYSQDIENILQTSGGNHRMAKCWSIEDSPTSCWPGVHAPFANLACSHLTKTNMIAQEDPRHIYIYTYIYICACIHIYIHIHDVHIYIYIEDAHGASHRRPHHFWRDLAHEPWHSWKMRCSWASFFEGSRRSWLTGVLRAILAQVGGLESHFGFK